MRLNHLNLAVSNVPEAKAFLGKYFGFKLLHPEMENRKFAVLLDESNMVLTLMSGGPRNEAKYPDNFHIGFALESEEAVNAVHSRLVADGYEITPPARLHGSWTFYFHMPGDVMVEVLA